MRSTGGLLLGTVGLSPLDALNGAYPAPGDEAATLRLQHTPGGLELAVEQGGKALHRLPLTADAVWRASESVLMVRPPSGGSALALRAQDEQGRQALKEVADQAASAAAGAPNLPAAAAAARAQDAQQPAAAQQQQQQQQGPGSGSGNHFDSKTDKGSADLYFHYYGCLQHQQNMLQDYIRTGTYYAAITENPQDFEGKVVMDVGCGSGILSLFAAQAGAKVVYAVEASDMAHHARHLAAANPGIGDRIRVLHGKVEEMEVPEKVDVLVSEPMGTLLVNERMIESYLYARDKFLKPGGKMFPRLGRVHLCAFSDEALYGEVAQKSAFFQNNAFYGVDLTPLHAPATAGYFGQVVVDQLPPNVLVSNCVTQTFDFLTCSEAELQHIRIPLSLQVAVPCPVHGVASWFDVLFDGTQTQRWLSTAPGLPITHWFQLRCLMERPVVVAQPGATVSGELRLVAHNRQSYDVHVMLRAPPLTPGGPEQVSTGKFDLKEPYYRQQMQWMMQMAQAAAPAAAADDGTAAADVAPAAAAALGAAGLAAGQQMDVS
ncbi:hypothetical protein ABPG75_005547 [Micractinium tetrahymenae]